MKFLKILIVTFLVFIFGYLYRYYDVKSAKNELNKTLEKIEAEGDTTIAYFVRASKSPRGGCSFLFFFYVDGKQYLATRGYYNLCCEQDSACLFVGKKFYVKYLKEDPNISRVLIDKSVE